MEVILTIIPYPFYPPTNGGALRCFYLLREMAKKHEVYLLTVQPDEDFTEGRYPAFPENVRIISIHGQKGYHSFLNKLAGKAADAVNYRILNRTFRGSTNSYFLQAYPSLLKVLNGLKPALVFYENLEAVGLFSSIIKRKLPTAKQIYDAHNVDSELWMMQYQSTLDKLYFKYSKQALKLESNLHSKIDSILFCSESDYIKIKNLNKNPIKGYLIPNGVDCLSKPYDIEPKYNKKNNLLFCGSLDYLPNKLGLLWFYSTIFPLIKKEIPSIRLTVIGLCRSNDGYESLIDDPQIDFIGTVDDVNIYYNNASVSIVPLLQGSGTRLKILEAMSFGVPVVSTSIGAEGINCINKKHILISSLDPKNFAQNVIRLLKNENIYNSIQIEAKKLVSENYDWVKIGRDLVQSINSIQNYNDNG